MHITVNIAVRVHVARDDESGRVHYEAPGHGESRAAGFHAQPHWFVSNMCCMASLPTLAAMAPQEAVSGYNNLPT